MAHIWSYSFHYFFLLYVIVSFFVSTWVVLMFVCLSIVDGMLFVFFVPRWKWERWRYMIRDQEIELELRRLFGYVSVHLIHAGGSLDDGKNGIYVKASYSIVNNLSISYATTTRIMYRTRNGHARYMQKSR